MASATDALATDSAFQRAENYLSDQRDPDLDFNDTLALRSILVMLHRAAQTEEPKAIAQKIRELNQSLAGHSRLSLGKEAVWEIIPEMAERILCVELLSGGKPWRRIYLNCQKLSPAARTKIGIREEQLASVTDALTRNVFLVKPPGLSGKEVADILAPLFEGARLVSIPEGQQFIRYGGRPKNVYLVVHGEAHVEAYDIAGIPIALEQQSSLKAGDIVGAKAVYFNQPCAADIAAGEGLEVLALPADRFRKLVDSDLQARIALTRLIEEQDRLDRQSTLSFLVRGAWESEPGLPPGPALAQGELGEERHELYDLLNLSIQNMEKINTLRAQEQCRALRQKKREFKEAYSHATKQMQGITLASVIQEGKSKGLTYPEPKLRAELRKRRARVLWDFIRSRGVAKLNAEECSTLFHAFRELGARQDMIDLYHQSTAAAFKTSPLAREFVAEALYRSGQTDQSLAVIDGLLQENYASAHLYWTVGEVYQRHAEEAVRRYEATKNSDTKAAQRAQADAISYQRISLRCLENGFLLDFAYDLGIKLLHACLKMARILPELYSQDITTIAEMVRFTAHKAGGFRANKLSVMTTLLQTDIILGLESEMEQVLGEILRMTRDEVRLDLVRADLEDLRDQLTGDQARLSLLERALARLHAPAVAADQTVSGAAAVSAQKHAPDASQGAQQTKAIFDLGYSYGEIRSNAVFGNISYGGKLHDHVVNSWDIAMARTILSRLGLLHAPDFQRFNRTVDKRLRERFDTSELEDLMSSQHKEYDDFMARLLEVMAVGPQDDSRTNVMMDWWLGRGDCRSHAFAKQLLFDVWKSFHTNKLLKEAYRAFSSLQPSRRQRYYSLMKKAQKLQRMHMLVFNTMLKAPIKMKKLYEEERDAQGRCILSDTVNPIEEHTLNVLVTLDENGNVSELRRVCAFYQNRYRFGGKRPLGGQRYEAGYPLNPVELLSQGQFTAGTIEAVDPATDATREVPVTMVPAPYAGGRLIAGIRKNADEYGQVLLRGIPIAGSVQEKSLQSVVAGFFDPDRLSAIRAFAQRVRNQRVRGLGNPAELLRTWETSALLRNESLTVEGIQEFWRFSPTTIRKDLAALQRLGIVQRERGKRAYLYRLTPRILRASDNALHEILAIEDLNLPHIPEEKISGLRKRIGHILGSRSKVSRLRSLLTSKKFVTASFRKAERELAGKAEIVLLHRLANSEDFLTIHGLAKDLIESGQCDALLDLIDWLVETRYPHDVLITFLCELIWEGLDDPRTQGQILEALIKRSVSSKEVVDKFPFYPISFVCVLNDVPSEQELRVLSQAHESQIMGFDIANLSRAKREGIISEVLEQVLAPEDRKGLTQIRLSSTDATCQYDAKRNAIVVRQTAPSKRDRITADTTPSFVSSSL